MRSRPDRPRPLRVTHCPVNIAGIPWANVEAQRRKGVDRNADRLLDLYARLRR